MKKPSERKIKITAKKQDNGLWGIPINCTSIDRIVPLANFADEVKRSAIIIGISEKYPEENFYVFFSCDDGFIVKLSNSGFKNISFADYVLTDNILTWVGNKSVEPNNN